MRCQEKLCCEGGEELAQLARGRLGMPHPWNVQGQAGWRSEQPTWDLLLFLLELICVTPEIPLSSASFSWSNM